MDCCVLLDISQGFGRRGVLVCHLQVGREAVGEVAEEVVMEDDGDAAQQLGVEGGAVEDVVDVAAVAVELPREPPYVAAFGEAVKHLAYHFADMGKRGTGDAMDVAFRAWAGVGRGVTGRGDGRFRLMLCGGIDGLIRLDGRRGPCFR